MGNHNAGRAMAAMAEVLKDRRKHGESALDVLDICCKEHEGSDAEFDDSCNPGEALGDLMIEAFAPGQTFDLDNDDQSDRWYETVYAPFRLRYEFC